jgi:Zn-dependent peptidase ImmA (M78 family)
VTAPVWVHGLAATFWRLAGGDDRRFPRDMRAAVARAFPLSPVHLPALQVSGVVVWLQAQGVRCTLDAVDRPLHACLVAHAGSGIVFLDTQDGPAEQRFSLAHELAHFLHDYWEPRRHAMEQFGEEVLEVFDGTRPPRPEERVQALLAQVPIGFRITMLDREPDGITASHEVDEVELNADQLALQLLAPEAVVLDALEPVPRGERRAAAQVLLIDRFGLPTQIAQRYAAILAPSEPEPSSFLRHLRLVE